MSDLEENYENMAELISDNLPEGSSGSMTENINTEKFLVFSILDKLYCFQSRFIGEIALFDSVYPLPLMPDFVLGVINRYSVPYALLDISLLFHNTPSPRNKLLIVKDEIDRVAFLIDDVEGIADIPIENIHVKDSDLGSNDLSGAVSASFTWNDSDVFVLNIHRILSRITGDIA